MSVNVQEKKVFQLEVQMTQEFLDQLSKGVPLTSRVEAPSAIVELTIKGLPQEVVEETKE